MKKIKKFLLFVLAFVMCFGSTILLSACKWQDDEEKINVVCTIFPEYDWVKEVIGDQIKNYNLTLLLDKGTELHSYDPTFEDIAKIANADLFVYVGGESDDWVEQVLENLPKQIKSINLLEVLGENAKIEEEVEGMQEEQNHENEEDEEEVEYDEHVWLSLKNAKIFVEAIGNSICEIDPENQAIYKSNVFCYTTLLDGLDGAYQSIVETANKNLEGSGKKATLLFGDRFPFRYLVDDYDLKYYAAFSGCSADTEASFETIAFLAEKVNELDLKAILQIESANGRIANQIRQSTTNKNQKILTLDSMQSTTTKSGETYYEIMVKNLKVLAQVII